VGGVAGHNPNAGFDGRPMRLSAIMTGHMPVKEAWMRCPPISPVSQSQFGL
jgi:hypothetical protein